MKLRKIIESYNERFKDFKNLKSVFSEDIINRFSKNMVNYIINNLPQSKEILVSRAGSNVFKDTIKDFFEKALTQPSILEGFLLSIFKTHMRKSISFKDFSLTYGRFLLDIIDYYVDKETSFSDKEREDYISFLKLLIIIYIFFVLNNQKGQESQQIDPLTGVFTKSYFHYNFKSLVNTYKTVVHFDIENFREINLFYGYSVGDTILSIFSSYLEHKFSDSQSLVVRYGADNFLVFTNDTVRRILEKIEDINKSLLRNTKIPTKYGLMPVSVNFISIILKTSLIKNLDLTEFNWVIEKEMKRLKRENRNIKVLNEKEINEYIEKYNVSVCIIKNLKEKNVKVALQGIYNKDKKLIFKEALARVAINDRLITPFIFLENLKDTNIEANLDRLVISKVIKFLKKNDYPFKISINVSSSFFKTYLPWFVDVVFRERKLRDYLIVEIVENNKIGEIKNIFRLLKKLKIKVLIDDFGCSYSNYDFLKNLNFDGVKIDGNIVKNVTKDKLDRYFIECILKLAKAKNMLVIAEYVENEEIIKILNKLADKMDYPNIGFQGYFFEKPEVAC